MRTLKKLRVSVALLGLTLVLSACPPTFVHPLSNPQTAKLDSRMVGIWDAGSSTVTVAANGNNIDIMIVEDKGDAKGLGVTGFNGFASVVGGRTYLNLRSKRWLAGDQVDLGSEWTIAKYEFNSNATEWTVSLMKEDALRFAITAKKLQANEDKSGDLHVTSDTGAVAAAIGTADPAKLFSTPAKPLRRIR